MGIENPSDPIVLPAQIKAEIAKVKEQIAISLLELSNIKRARQAEELSVKECLKEKESLQAEISKLQNSVAGYEEKNSTLSAKALKTYNENEKLIKMNTEIANEIEERKKAFQSRASEVEIAESKLKAEKDAFHLEVEEFKIKESKIIKFKDSLESVLKSY